LTGRVCRPVIVQWITEHQTDPATGASLHLEHLYPNLVVRDLIQGWIVANAAKLDPALVERVTRDFPHVATPRGICYSAPAFSRVASGATVSAASPRSECMFKGMEAGMNWKGSRSDACMARGEHVARGAWLHRGRASSEEELDRAGVQVSPRLDFQRGNLLSGDGTFENGRLSDGSGGEATEFDNPLFCSSEPGLDS
jgi:hypothetical protein